MLAVAVFFTGQYMAAQEVNSELKEWVKCSKEAIDTFNNREIRTREIMVCEYLDAVIGSECDDAILILSELNYLEIEMKNFLLFNVITPTCGPFPR